MIRTERLEKDVKTIAGFTQTPGEGATRPTFSAAWAQAMQYVASEASAAGCQWRTDAAGNGHAWPESLLANETRWLCGSHLDSVPHGGDFDGVAGVVAALELLRSAKEDGRAMPLEMVVFAEEEGTTFGLGMIGSRLWTGALAPEQLQNFRNAGGETYIEAGRPHGVDPARFCPDRIQPKRYFGFVEIHIEQGPSMWRSGQRLAVVTAIAGRKQYRVTLHGEANHAGATPMPQRRDALCAAAEMILAIEKLPAEISAEAVATVGLLTNYPNAVNVVPDRTEFTIDLRAPSDALLAGADTGVRAIVMEIARRRGINREMEVTESIGACPLDERLCKRLAGAAREPIVTSVSGALHDSAIIAPHVPTAMLFIPSRDGISHNPAEFSRIEDLAAAAELLERVVRRPTISRINEMTSSEFLSVCGGAFEHSPWIAERAWQSRPFASIADLHEKMTSVVSGADIEKKLALVRAHPDLVGRLAREGKLTRESSSEQAAAGLAKLSESEVAAFERFNADYRNKFGFPFVICARENRKDAILEAMPPRLANSRDAELATALAEIFKIARLRLADAIWEN